MKTNLFWFLSVFMLLLFAACAGPQAIDTDVAPLTPTAVAPVEQPSLAEATRVEFPPEASTWQASGNFEAEAARQFVVAGLAGQQLTIWLSTTPPSDSANLHAWLNIIGADGQVFSFSPEQYWSAVLPTTQDYLVEIHPLGQQEVTYQIVIEKSPTTIDPALGSMYDPIPDALCQELRAMASESLGVEFFAQTRAPFFDALGGEAGQGCHLGAGGDGTQFNSPQDVLSILTGSVGAGWIPLPGYQADGPTGTFTALARDMALMLISVNWQPAADAQCPADQPISKCSLTPEQKIYTIEVDIANYKSDFSLDGQWEDAATHFSLDLYQDWKVIYGGHVVVAQDGNKIDTLDASLHGMLQGKVVTVQFQSSFTTDTGTAQITYIDVNTIQWKIIEPPDGEHYLPQEATLTRK